MIVALAFVTEGKVVNESHKLYDYFVNEVKSSEAISILFRFQNNYLREDNADTNKKINFWNVYLRSLNDISRTANSLEGYHRHLNLLVGLKQQTICKIGEKIVKEQTL